MDRIIKKKKKGRGGCLNVFFLGGGGRIASGTLVSFAVAHRHATGTAAELELAFGAFGEVDSLLLADGTFGLDVEPALGFQLGEKGVHVRDGFRGGGEGRNGEGMGDGKIGEMRGVELVVGPLAGVAVFLEGAVEEGLGDAGLGTGDGGGGGADAGQGRLRRLGAGMVHQEGRQGMIGRDVGAAQTPTQRRRRQPQIHILRRLHRTHAPRNTRPHQQLPPPAPHLLPGRLSHLRPAHPLIS